MLGLVRTGSTARKELDMAREFEVWTEGYAATGESQNAAFRGMWKGETFKDACKAWFDSLPETSRVFVYNGHASSYYDAENNTYWGCRLSDNEADARERFG